MATVKVILWKHDQKADGSFPIAIRITKNRKPKYIFTGQYVQLKDWDEKEKNVKRSHPNATRLNNLILKKLSEAHAIVLEDETNGKDLSTKQLKSKIKHKGRQVSFFSFASDRVKTKFLKKVYSVAKSELSILFNLKEFLQLNPSMPLEQAIEMIKNNRKQRVSDGRTGKVTVFNHIENFSKDTKLYFEDMNPGFLGRYANFCSIYLGQKSRTINNQMIFIRTLFNLAIKEGVVDAKHYPFAGDKHKIIIKQGHKIGLEREEVARIEALELKPGTSIWDARCAWLFSFYFAGMRASDVFELKWRDFKNGRLFYAMNKNEKQVSLKIPDKVLPILEYYKQQKRSKDDYVFPFLKKANDRDSYDIYVKSKNAIDLLNKHLKRLAKLCDIDKNLSNHIARHSFGNIAGDQIPIQMLQKLYRHSSITTTVNYQANFMHKDTDDALEKVIGF